MRQFRNKYGEPFSMAEALDNLTKPQSTKAFQELTSGWRKVNGEVIKGNYPSYREQNQQPQQKGFNLKQHKEDYG